MLHNRTEVRRRYLKDHYYFVCECSKCLDVTGDQLKSSLKCSKCQDGCGRNQVKYIPYITNFIISAQNMDLT